MCFKKHKIGWIESVKYESPWGLVSRPEAVEYRAVCADCRAVFVGTEWVHSPAISKYLEQLHAEKARLAAEVIALQARVKKKKK